MITILSCLYYFSRALGFVINVLTHLNFCCFDWKQPGVSRGHVDVWGLCFNQGLYWCLLSNLWLVTMLRSMYCLGCWVDDHGLYCHKMSHWCLFSVLPPKSRWVTVVCDTAWNNAKFHGPACCQKPHCVHGHFAPESMLMSLINGYDGFSGLCCSWEGWVHEAPHKSNNLDRKPSKKHFKFCDKDTEV